MGINILIINIKGISIDDSPGGPPVNFVDYERVEWFDTGRQVGDKDFIYRDDFEKDYFKDAPEDERFDYWRPADFKEAKSWVEKNINSGSRLINALNKMETDTNLYFHISY